MSNRMIVILAMDSQNSPSQKMKTWQLHPLEAARVIVSLWNQSFYFYFEETWL